MATDINSILNWFKTGLKPTQAQFWASWQSFFHKDEPIPQASITGLPGALNSKADKSQFDAHKTDPNAHAALFAKVRFVQFGDFIVFKANGNENDAIREPGDVGCGWLEDGVTFIPFGKFLGGDDQDVANWNTSPMTFT